MATCRISGEPPRESSIASREEFWALALPEKEVKNRGRVRAKIRNMRPAIGTLLYGFARFNMVLISAGTNPFGFKA
jgi:hypothetical protein